MHTVGLHTAAGERAGRQLEEEVAALLPSRDRTHTILASVVAIVSLVVLLVATGVLAPSDTGRFGRYLQPFAGLRGTERLVVLILALVLLVLAASTFLTARNVIRVARRR